MTTQTIAQQIAAFYDTDGSMHTRLAGCTCGKGETVAHRPSEGHAYDCAGVETTIFDDCKARATSHHSGPGSRYDSIRYDFADGSSIVVSPGAWDFGVDGSNCCCWAGSGAHAECPEAAQD